MQILVDLVKVGALGASLAFLYLSYDLLQKELALKDKDGQPQPPRKEGLDAIRRFRWSAIAFLLIGVASEFFLSNGGDVLRSVDEWAFGNRMERILFTRWKFLPESKMVGFS